MPLFRDSAPPPPTPELELERAISRHRGAALGAPLRARGLGAYRGYGELLEHVRALASRSVFRLEVFGKSVEGEPLFALCAGAEPRASMVRTTVTLSGIHPSEWIGIETHLGLLDRLGGFDGYQRSLIAIVVANPDGFLRVEKNLRNGRRRFIRHNARGVDLNRNFDHAWGELGLVQRLLGGVFNPGTSPASEPEVEAISHLLSRCRVDRALSLHSFGGAVLYPAASSLARVHDEAEHRAWAERLARAIDPERPYTARACAKWAKGITAGGLELDWFHDRHGALSLLIECSRGGRGLDPRKWLEPFAWFNPPKPARDVHAIADAVLPFVKGLD